MSRTCLILNTLYMIMPNIGLLHVADKWPDHRIFFFFGTFIVLSAVSCVQVTLLYHYCLYLRV